MASMSGGRPPTPTALRVLEGNRGKRPLRREPIATGTPPPPAWLKGEARRLWMRTVPELQRMGLIGKVDEIGMVLLCQNWSRWKDVELELDEPGLDSEATGRLRRDSSRLSKDLWKALSEFGMSPVARARVATPQTLEDETLGGLLR
jgi:P27 family predicted phage terminase small subunit